MKKLILLLALAAFTHTASAQSLLTTPPETTEQRTARTLVEGMQATKRVILREFGQNVATLWDSPNPQGALDILGAGGSEAFRRSEQMATFLNTILTESGDTAGLAELAAILAKVKPVTVHEDGTVTINPEPTPTPEP